MNSERRTAIVVGTLFIAATVASILGSVVLGSVADGRDYLVGLANHESQVIFAALLFLVASTTLVGTAFLLFPILRRHAGGLAIGYVGLRVFEGVFFAVGTVALLSMLTVSKSDTASTANATDLALLGAALAALRDWSGWIGTTLFFALGSLTLNYVLFQSRLVPRWLSLLGLGAAALALGYGLIGMFDVGVHGLGSPYALLAMPIAVQEMVFALWLMFKGFDQRAIQGHAPELRIDMTKTAASLSKTAASISGKPRPTA